MVNRLNPWTPEEDEALVTLWENDADVDEIAEATGRSTNAVYSRVAELRLPRRQRGSVPWTRAEQDTLRRLFERGLSDAEIADKLGNRSINAVVRQRGGMGLTRRPDRSERQIERPMPVVGPAKTCQWIEGDPKKGETTMCGRPSVEGKSYCGAHARRAYRQAGDPPLPKKQWKDPMRVTGNM